MVQSFCQEVVFGLVRSQLQLSPSVWHSGMKGGRVVQVHALLPLTPVQVYWSGDNDVGAEQFLRALGVHELQDYSLLPSHHTKFDVVIWAGQPCSPAPCVQPLSIPAPDSAAQTTTCGTIPITCSATQARAVRDVLIPLVLSTARILTAEILLQTYLMLGLKARSGATAACGCSHVSAKQAGQMPAQDFLPRAGIRV